MTVHALLDLFDGDYAVHGTELENELGLPASAGCVRLSKKTPKYYLSWSRSTDPQSFSITIVD